MWPTVSVPWHPHKGAVVVCRDGCCGGVQCFQQRFLMIRNMRCTEWHQDHWLSHVSREPSIAGATAVLLWAVTAVHRKPAQQ